MLKRLFFDRAPCPCSRTRQTRTPDTITYLDLKWCRVRLQTGKSGSRRFDMLGGRQ
jgi:hypothetical protein